MTILTKKGRSNADSAPQIQISDLVTHANETSHANYVPTADFRFRISRTTDHDFLLSEATEQVHRSHA